MKNTYFSTAIGLYLNYLVHGMGVILMSLNMSSLEQQWHTDAAGVSIVISSLGIGRLSVLLVAGMLSDRYGRKPAIVFGCFLFGFSTLAVVAAQRLLDQLEVLVQGLLRLPGGAVNALQHFVLAVAAPVGAGYLHQLEGFQLAG